MKGNFFDLANRFSDLVVLNIIFIISCVPVITVGPALTALYCVSMKISDGSEGYVVKSYFRAFKDNFKQGMLVGIVLEIICFVLGYDAVMLYYSQEFYAAAGFFITVVMLVIIALVIQFVFPLLARYQNTIGNTVKNSALLAVSKLPYALLLLVPMLFCVLVCYLSIFGYLYVGLFGCSFCALLQSKILKRVFKQVDDVRA
jgi:uncharacterized membrane protein YesL